MAEANTVYESVPRWFGSRLLVVCVSATDAVMHAGELLQLALGSEREIRVAVLTDGPRVWRRPRQSERGRANDMRNGAKKALSELGITGECMGFYSFPIDGLTEDLLARRSRLLALLRDEIRCFQPTLIVAPSRRDEDPDCNAVGVAVEKAISECKTSAPACIAFLTHGELPPAEAADVFEVPFDHARREKKRRVLKRSTSGTEAGSVENQQIDAETERFLVVPGRPIDVLRSHSDRDPLVIRTAARWLRNAGVVYLLPAEHYLDPAVAGLGSPKIRPGLGGRASDTLAIEKQANAVEFRFSASHGPVWVRGSDSGVGCKGWLRLETLPQSHPRTDAVCCVVHCNASTERCQKVLADATTYADLVIAVDYGKSGETFARVGDRAHLPGNLHVIVAPRDWDRDKSLLTAMRYALLYLEFGSLVSLDVGSDQDPRQIPRLVAAMRTSGAAMAIGGSEENPSKRPFDQLKHRFIQRLLRALFPHAPTQALSTFRCHSRDLVVRAVESLDEDCDEELGLRILAMALDRGPVAEVSGAGTGRGGATGPDSDTLRAMLHKVSALSRIAVSRRRKTRAGTGRQYVSGRTRF